MYIFMLRYVQLLHALEQNCHMIAILYINYILNYMITITVMTIMFTVKHLFSDISLNVKLLHYYNTSKRHVVGY